MTESRWRVLRRIGGLAAAGAAGIALVVTLYDGSARSGAPVTVTVSGRAPAPGGQGEGSLVGDVIRALEPASVAFNAPRTLQLNEPAVIQVLLSGNRTVAELERELTARGEREGDVIRVSDAMEAQLSGSGFAVENVTPTVQLVSRDAVTEWKWEVEPTETGERRLHLALSALIDVNGSERPYTVRTFERTLVVEVTLRRRLETFAEENWQWLWTAILVPVGAWWLQRRRHRASPPSGSTPPGAPPEPTPR
jgi:hypothetical protein